MDPVIPVMPVPSVDDSGAYDTSGCVGVVGLGIVGGTIRQAFDEAGIEAVGYDPYLGIGKPPDLRGCSAVFLCVPTPGVPAILGDPGGPEGSRIAPSSGAWRGGYDLTEVRAALDAVVPHLHPSAIVAVKSTVPPGTCDALAAELPGTRFASVPEFLVASRPTESFTGPDRILIGCRSTSGARLLARYMHAVAPLAPIVVVSPVEAELVKLCSNAMLAAKVSMANELAGICGQFHVEWATVQACVGLDRRIGPDHLTVTPEGGFGGQCLPKDLDGLIVAAASAGYRPRLLEEIAGFNRAVRAALADPSGRQDPGRISETG